MTFILQVVNTTNRKTQLSASVCHSVKLHIESHQDGWGEAAHCSYRRPVSLSGHTIRSKYMQVYFTDAAAAVCCVCVCACRGKQLKYIFKVWQKLWRRCQPVVTETDVPDRPGKTCSHQKLLCNHKIKKHSQDTEASVFCCLCVCVCCLCQSFCQTPHFFFSFCISHTVLSFLMSNFIIVCIERISGADLHQPIIYSLTWIFQAVAHLSPSRCWEPSPAALILRDTGPDVAYLKNKFSVHVDPALWITGLRGI